MSTITFGGPITSALTHFALYGLADIAEHAFGPGITLGWTSEQEPKAWVDVPSASPEEIGAAVTKAAVAESPRTWMSVQINYGNGATASPFSPRIKAIDPGKQPEDWETHQAKRHHSLDTLTTASDTAELRFLSALGEASYWHIVNNGRQPDRGATRWEMKTRNRGEEFVLHRYEPLCREVSSWTAEQVLEGLTGRSIRDPLGKNKQDSRSSTGFTRPAPADNAVVFCALRGITDFPMAHLVSRINATPGAWPSTVLHPRSMLLPVPVSPVTPARLRSVIISEQLSTVHDTLMTDKDSTLTADAARKWLAVRKFVALVRFPILKTGSSSAPERQVLDGEVHLNVE